MEVLPHDLIEEIFERLSPKSLFRFKSVSKQWKSTIESPFFQQRHLIHHRQKSKSTPHLLVINIGLRILQSIITLELKSSISHNIPIPCEKNNLSTVCKNSIDGLICLYNDYNSVVIFNPTTRWYRTLPPSAYQQRKSYREFSLLGFGKDEINGLYKPVWLYNSRNATICEVFDFNLNTWRFIEPSSPKYMITNGDKPVYVTGLLYWLTKKGEEENQSVLSLDLHTETFEIVCKTPFRNSVIYNLNDNLCGLSDFGNTEVLIWSLNLEEKTWKKLYNIDLSKICPYEDCWRMVWPVAFMGENKLMLIGYCNWLGLRKQRLMLYDRETISSHEVCTHDFTSSLCYFQSLISIL